MDQFFLIVAGLIYLGMGALHGVLALRDLSRPRTFTPTDDSVRKAMQGVPLALHSRLDLWRAWLGFNLSHSLGLIVVGGALTGIAVWHVQVFTLSTPLQMTAVGVSALYLVLSVRFWFSGPVIGTSVATVCLIVAALVSQWRAT